MGLKVGVVGNAVGVNVGGFEKVGTVHCKSCHIYGDDKDVSVFMFA